MKLRIGLTQPSMVWERLLAQEGVPHTVIRPDGEIDAREHSVVVVTRAPGEGESRAILRYLKGGGAILSCADYVGGLPGLASRAKHVRYLVGDHDPLFPDLELLDLDMDCRIPREATHLRTNDNSAAVFAGELEGGHAVILPVDPGRGMADTRRADRSFYAEGERLPWETVSRVSKGGLRRLVVRAIEHLHHRRGLPYVHLWYYPDGAESVFSFRIDSDAAPQADVDALRRVAQEWSAPLTWFLDVASHESWLHRFRDFEGDEIGVHCYEHRVKPDRGFNSMNIQRALDALRKVGFLPEGYAAPYGYWDPGLGEVIDSMGFTYSSEFSWSYDSLPMAPVTEARAYHTLQVPIHPVCIGSMLRSGFTSGAMERYFARSIEEKLARREPLMFYHHPTHREWSVLGSLFADVRRREIPAMTMGSFARWWLERGKLLPGLTVAEDEISVGWEGGIEPSPALHVRISEPTGGEAIVPAEPSIRRSSLVRGDRALRAAPDDIRRVRDFDPRQYLNRLHTAVTRTLR